MMLAAPQNLWSLVYRCGIARFISRFGQLGPDHRHESLGGPAAGDCQWAVWAAISYLMSPAAVVPSSIPATFFGPMIAVEGESVTMPQLAAPELQNQTTARSQAVELRQAAHPPTLSSCPRRDRNASLRRRSLLCLRRNLLSQSCNFPPMRLGPSCITSGRETACR